MIRQRWGKEKGGGAREQELQREETFRDDLKMRLQRVARRRDGFPLRRQDNANEIVTAKVNITVKVWRRHWTVIGRKSGA